MPGPKEVRDIKTDAEALIQVCGSESMAKKAQALWDEMHEKNRLDLSDQKLSDEEIGQLLKGIHMCAPGAACHFFAVAMLPPPPPLPP